MQQMILKYVVVSPRFVWKKHKLPYKKPLFEIKNLLNPLQEWKEPCICASFPTMKLRTPMKTCFASCVIFCQKTLPYMGVISICFGRHAIVHLFSQVPTNQTLSQTSHPMIWQWKFILSFFHIFVDGCCPSKTRMIFMCRKHPWNNRFHVNFEWINEASKFEMLGNNDLIISETLMPAVKKCVFKQSYDYCLYLIPWYFSLNITMKIEMQQIQFKNPSLFNVIFSWN